MLLPLSASLNSVTYTPRPFPPDSHPTLQLDMSHSCLGEKVVGGDRGTETARSRLFSCATSFSTVLSSRRQSRVQPGRQAQEVAGITPHYLISPSVPRFQDRPTYSSFSEGSYTHLVTRQTPPAAPLPDCLGKKLSPNPKRA